MVRFLALVALCAPVLAADPPKKAGPIGYELKFADGTTVQATIADASVVVATKYGKLTVPLADVKRIEFGFRYPDGMQAKVDAVVGDFGSKEFAAREKACKDILTFGEFALPAVKRAMRSDSPEVVRRAKEAHDKIAKTLTAEVLELREYDVLHTADGTIRGTIETTGFKAKTKYFGETTLNLADLRDLRPVGVAARDEFALDADKHAKQRWAAWHDTGLNVTERTTLDISVSGKIDQWPQSPGQYMAGPGGSTGFVAGPGGGGPVVPGGPFQGGGGGQYKSGAVYGKVGESGTPFLIAEAYKGKPTGKGKLYVIIAPSHWGNENCTGEFTVKLKAGE